jgi:hypothetical protein
MPAYQTAKTSTRTRTVSVHSTRPADFENNHLLKKQSFLNTDLSIMRQLVLRQLVATQSFENIFLPSKSLSYSAVDFPALIDAARASQCACRRVLSRECACR